MTLANVLDDTRPMRIGWRRDKGDVLTGDGIERVSEEQGHPAPDGGEGGSVLQALGSKEVRKTRREEKKQRYAAYLESATWKKIRAKVLKRDKQTCLACKGRAQVVHHIRYPKKLGEEKLEWLYSLCMNCHDEIHRLAQTTTLRKATRFIIDCPPGSKVVRLPDDWQLSKRATRSRQFKKKKPSRKVGKGPEAKMKKGKLRLAEDNERLHEIQRKAREKRERRSSWQ